MDILDILKKHGVLKEDVSEDTLAEMNKDLRVNYKSVAEYRKLKDDLSAANEKLSAGTDFEGKYNTLKSKYDADIAAKQKELDEFKFDSKVGAALSGIEFSSDRVKSSIMAEIKAKEFKLNDKGEIDGITDYLKELYTKEPDNFKAVDAGIHTWAGGSDNDANKNKASASNVFNRVW